MAPPTALLVERRNHLTHKTPANLQRVALRLVVIDPELGLSFARTSAIFCIEASVWSLL